MHGLSMTKQLIIRYICSDGYCDDGRLQANELRMIQCAVDPLVASFLYFDGP